MLFLDLETRSQVDLRVNGLMRYAMDKTTETICMCYAFDDGPVKTWFAEDGPFPAEVIDYIQYTNKPLSAHNAAFERLLFDFVLSNDYDFKPPAVERWQCTSARAMAHGLPASLSDICRALELPLQKQTEGTRLIRDYCAPNFDTVWKPGDKELMADYCRVDVEAMRMFCSVLRQLEPDEWQQYHITEIMNDRGVPLDIPFVTAALEYADAIRSDVADEIVKLTEGKVLKATQRKCRDEWLKDNLTDELAELITVEVKGVTKIKFDAEYRKILAQHPDTPDIVSNFIELVEQAGGATISKYKSMLNTHVEGRVHGSLIWNGAGATGRFASRGLQLQNFKRDVFKDPEPLIDSVIAGVGIDKPAASLGRLIRSAITSAEGLTYSDYSQIEARVLPWLSADERAEVTLDIFRGGRDLYTENAVGMFGLKSTDEVTPELRQSAKQGVLACGFGGGAGAVQAMAKGYGLKYTHEQADAIKNAWRNANPWAYSFWYGLKDAAQTAVKYPGSVQSFGRLSFMFDGHDWLWMRLPSGRCLAYFQPRFEIVEYPWGDEGWELTCLWGSGKPKAGEKWPRRVLNHLILSENATQAAAADVMREAIVRAHQAGLKVLFSVHDELVVEGQCFDKLHSVMTTPPTWAAGLPIDADTQTAKRYGK